MSLRCILYKKKYEIFKFIYSKYIKNLIYNHYPNAKLILIVTTVSINKLILILKRLIQL